VLELLKQTSLLLLKNPVLIFPVIVIIVNLILIFCVILLFIHNNGTNIYLEISRLVIQLNWFVIEFLVLKKKFQKKASFNAIES
jgi:hypothetical protein